MATLLRAFGPYLLRLELRRRVRDAADVRERDELAAREREAELLLDRAVAPLDERLLAGLVLEEAAGDRREDDLPDLAFAETERLRDDRLDAGRLLVELFVARFLADPVFA